MSHIRDTAWICHPYSNLHIPQCKTDANGESLDTATPTATDVGLNLGDKG